jgi:hypothetical protein
MVEVIYRFCGLIVVAYSRGRKGRDEFTTNIWWKSENHSYKQEPPEYTITSMTSDLCSSNIQVWTAARPNKAQDASNMP